MSSTITPWISAFSSIGFLNSGVRDDDLTDRLNHGAMSTILLCLALTTCIKEYMGEPIACWIPTEYKSKRYKDYVHGYCWIHRLYSLPMEDSIPLNSSERYENDLAFYRWATIFFILQAGMFQIPRLAWNAMKSLSGLQLDAVIAMSLETAIMSDEKRDEKLGHLAEFFHRWIVCRAKVDRTGKFRTVRNFLFNSFLFCSGQSGKQTVSMYLLVKILYLTNVIAQFFLVTAFLDVNFWDFGVSAFKAYFDDGIWEDEYNFPRVAMCDFQIRQMTNVQTFTVQCVLAMNLFLEKMFLALWFCFLFLIVANSVSLFRWIVSMLNSGSSTELFVHYIDAIIPWHQCSPEMYQDFISSYLRADGVFVIKMVAVNTSDLHAAEIVQHLWLRYKQHKKDSEE